MNWKKRKLITGIVAIATIGALYAFVGPRHYHHGCHWEQNACHSEKQNAVTPDNSITLEVE